MAEENPTPEIVETQESEAQPANWDNPFEGAFEVKEEPEVVSETVVDPEAPVPTEETTETATAEVVEEEPEEEPTLEEVTTSDGLPPLSRKRLGEIKKTVLDPLRNPEVPISDARDALRQFHPTRAQELEQAIVNDSATNYPNDWIAALTGVDGLTVERVLEALSIADQPRQEPKDDSQDITEYLTELYGEDWKNPLNDSQLADDDRNTARLARRAIDLESRINNGDTELKSQLDANKKELDDLRKMAQDFKTKQEQDTQATIKKTFDESVTTYRSEIEHQALPKLFTDLGLEASEQDTPSVKAVKGAVKAYFEPVYGQPSDFELFIQNEFTNRGQIEKIASRVATHHSQAAELLAQGHEKEAKALYERAKEEQSALVVLTRKAAKDFTSTPKVKAQMELLEENANLRLQLGKGRPEIIGQSSVAQGGSWLEEAKESGDIWNPDLIGSRLSAAR